MTHPAKILLITNIPTPYRIPLFNEIDRQLSHVGLSFKVVFAMPGYRRRKWRVDLSDCAFDYVFLTGSKALNFGKESPIFTYSGLVELLRRENSCAVVTAGFSIATTKLWMDRFFVKIPYIIWSGAIDSPGQTVSRLRTWHRRMLVRKAAAYIAYGSRAKSYLTSLGASEERVFVAINTVDTDFFGKECDKSRSKLRDRGDEDDRPHVLLAIGNFVSRKRFDMLLYAVSNLKKIRNDFVLILIGDGPEKEILEALARQLQVEKYVRFAGYRQKSELPPYLAGSACFLFPSEREIWGLVLVEAMASGIPCLASVHAGATPDLIMDGETGFVQDFSDHCGVANRIQWILEHPEEAKIIGAAGRKFIEKYATLSVSAGGVVEAILACGATDTPPKAVK